MSDDSESKASTRRRRWGSFRTWEIVVIAIAIVLFIVAAFAGPQGEPNPPVAVSPSAPASVEPGATPSDASPVPVPTGSPVATVEQILAETVGDYELVDRKLSEAGASGGALQSTELRYSLEPPDPDADVFHAIEIHASAAAARQRVRTFGAALGETGYTTVREQPLRNGNGEIQGYFMALRGPGGRLLLWSNRNVTFSLGGGADVDVDAFYDALPY